MYSKPALVFIVVGSLVLLLITYQFGKSQGSAKLIPFPSPSPGSLDLIIQIETPEPVLTPIVKPKINTIKRPPAPIKTVAPVRSKVPVTLTDVALSGTYYCFDDKANELMNTQNNLKLALKTFEFCGSNINNQISSCFSNCGTTAQSCIINCPGGSNQAACHSQCNTQQNTCMDNCPSTNETTCNPGEVEKIRNQLTQQKQDYCP